MSREKRVKALEEMQPEESITENDWILIPEDEAAILHSELHSSPISPDPEPVQVKDAVSRFMTLIHYCRRDKRKKRYFGIFG